MNAKRYALLRAKTVTETTCILCSGPLEEATAPCRSPLPGHAQLLGLLNNGEADRKRCLELLGQRQLHALVTPEVSSD